ncbi:MAG: hypothetical protein JSS81_10865 [Acidobacteria bacterium]|nr:hypothetical protein [Acidobacteriota bacterium]
MKLSNFSKFLGALALALIVGGSFACGGKPAANTGGKTNSSAPDQKPPTMTDVPVGNAQTPTEAYKMLFAAVKSQDPAKIKLMLSKGTMGLAGMAADQQKKPVDEVVKNGFTATTFADNYPQMRDERIKDNFGALEVWNEKEKKWEDLPFMYEDGGWKLAVGEMFGGSYKSPGKGQAQIEQENANASLPNPMTNGLQNSNANGNFAVPKRPDKSKAK